MDYKNIIKYTKDLDVLYVEDEYSILKNTENILEDFFGYVQTAQDGLEGLEKYKQYFKDKNQYFDIVLTDIKMPRKDGISMIKDILKINSNQPVIAISSYNETDVLMNLIKLGISSFIMKPIEPKYLMDVLNEISQNIYNKKEKIRLEIQTKLIEEKNISQKNKINSMKKLVQNIGHQWRQPLSMISIDATGLKMQHKSGNLTTDNLNYLCDSIEKTAQELSLMINDFSDYLNTDSVINNFYIEDVIDKCLNILNLKYSNIIKNIDKELMINTYEVDFLKVILSILENSKDATTNEEIEKQYIFIDAHKLNNEIVISIKDNGNGIKNENLNDIFNLYYTTKHQYVGIGASLYSVYNIITEKMDGTIDVENQSFEYDGKQYIGANITIKLPL